MENLLNALKDLSAINFIFLFLSIVAIVLTIIFFFRSKKEKMPHYMIKSFNLVGENITSLENLEVKFKGTEIENLTSTQISLFNVGNLAIRREDIASKDKLRIEPEEGIKILDWKIKRVKSEVNNFSISSINKNLEIDFDFFGKNEGVVIQLFHTGKSSDELKIKGTIINSNPIKLTEGVLLNAKRLQKFVKYSNERIREVQMFLAPFVVIAIIYILLDNWVKGNQTVPKMFMLNE